MVSHCGIDLHFVSLSILKQFSGGKEIHDVFIPLN